MKDVRGLDITMHNPGLMRRIQAARDLHGPLWQLTCLQWLGPDAVLQRLPLRELHADGGLAFLLADFVYHANVRMTEGGGARFPIRNARYDPNHPPGQPPTP
jgi:hypothetical protein